MGLRREFILLCLLGGFQNLQASGLQRMFESLGSEANITTPGGFQDQAAGYYTGGGLVMRQKSKVVQPFNVSLPHMGMGCGGLDMYYGAFSAIKGEEMVQLLRSVSAGVPTYAFQLALKTMAPQLETLMTQVRKYVQDLNMTMLDSCNATQNLVGGLWPKGTAASETICQDSMRGNGEDWFGARKHCQNKDAVSRKVSEARQKSPDLLQGEYNLTWHVLQKMPDYKDDKAFCQFILTTVGTLISRKEPDGRFKIHILHGKADQKDYLATYLKGGQTVRYTCQDFDQCLTPVLSRIGVQDTAENPQTMKAKTSRMIQSLWNKYRENKELTPSELSFLNDAVTVPVYRYIQISAALGTPFMMDDTSEYIAVSVLLSQFDKISAEILTAVETLESIQLESGTLEKFKSHVQALRGRLQRMLSTADGEAIWRLTQMIRGYEQTLAARSD